MYKSTTVFWPKHLGWKVDLYTGKYGNHLVWLNKFKTQNEGTLKVMTKLIGNIICPHNCNGFPNIRLHFYNWSFSSRYIYMTSMFWSIFKGFLAMNLCDLLQIICVCVKYQYLLYTPRTPNGLPPLLAYLSGLNFRRTHISPDLIFDGPNWWNFGVKFRTIKSGHFH